MSKLADIKTNFPQWYQDVIFQAGLADQSPVRGTFVIPPYGYALWERIQEYLDKRIKETGHQNASFPLFIPESFLKKEAEHVEGFAPELAVVTHAGGKELEEPLVVRPTSETIIHYMFARWIKSWRDLPLKINQWCSVVRWEMRPRAFLRTTEFLWQEGHTAHETHDEAEQEVLLMLNEYVNLAQDFLAIPVITGLKSKHEKFPGAEKTYTFEGMMQDGKALQMGTSHLLSQSFAYAFDMIYQDKEGKKAYPYLTSWCGATTRLIGALVMVHGDQKGLVLPPRIAPIQVVIIPILKKDADNNAVLDAATALKKSLESNNIRAHLDADEHETPGAKFYKWELKGVPVRLEIGPRDLEKGSCIVSDRIGHQKSSMALAEVAEKMPAYLDTLQKTMFQAAHTRLKSMWHGAEKLTDFGQKLEADNGFYQTGWCQDHACELELKKYKASTRCLLEEKTMPMCFNCDKPSIQDVIVARAY